VNIAIVVIFTSDASCFYCLIRLPELVFGVGK